VTVRPRLAQRIDDLSPGCLILVLAQLALADEARNRQPYADGSFRDLGALVWIEVSRLLDAAPVPEMERDAWGFLEPLTPRNRPICGRFGKSPPPESNRQPPDYKAGSLARPVLLKAADLRRICE
jgi:hypothetical protein